MLVMLRLRKAGLQFHIEKTLLTVKRHLKVGRNEGEKERGGRSLRETIWKEKQECSWSKGVINSVKC